MWKRSNRLPGLVGAIRKFFGTSYAGDFATTMRELSARVGRDQPRGSPGTGGIDARISLAERYRANLESVLTRRIENIDTTSYRPGGETASQFQKIEEHLPGYRTSESVNQRLFDRCMTSY